VERDDELSIRPRVLLLLVLVLVALVAALALEVMQVAPKPGPGSPAPSTNPSWLPPGSEVPFGISGNVEELAPGLTKAIVVTFANPNPVSIYVTDVVAAVAADSVPTGCSSVANMTVHQATGITEEAPVAVPAGESVTVRTAPRAPSLSFHNLDVDQDECKGVSFELTFTGKAHA
jgi:hypothetical protein